MTVADEAPESSAFAERWSYGLMRAVSMEPARGEFPGISTPAWADALINMASAALFAAVLWVAFRSVRATDPITADDEERLRTLLARHGETDSLGYFALRRDKSVVFSPTGKAAVTYRVVGGVSLASADPLGDPEAWPGAIERWLTEAREHGWTPAVMGASELGGTVYARHGLDALELGDEAVVEIADFSLEGRAMRGVRQAYHRVRRAGYTVRMRRHADIGAEEMARLVRLADDWRDGDTERGFSMALGRLGDPADGNCLMLECMDAEGRLRALLSFVPWGEKGLSLHLMRRDRESVNGLIEFMVLDLIRRGRGPDHPAVPQLRHVPVRLRARGPARRGAGAAGVALTARLLLPLVADRVPLPCQRQVPPRLGAPLHALREEHRRAAHRARRRPRRGLPHSAGTAEVDEPGPIAAGSCPLNSAAVRGGHGRAVPVAPEPRSGRAPPIWGPDPRPCVTGRAAGARPAAWDGRVCGRGAVPSTCLPLQGRKWPGPPCVRSVAVRRSRTALPFLACARATPLDDYEALCLR